jgi:hypothetical protein
MTKKEKKTHQIGKNVITEEEERRRKDEREN